MTREEAEQQAANQRAELESHGAFNIETDIRFIGDGFYVFLKYDVDPEGAYFPPVTGEGDSHVS
jgi:hypothetical protein